MIPIVKIWLFETDLLDPYFIGEKDGITVTLENDDNIDFLDIQTVTYFMNSIVKGAFSEDFKYGGEDGGVAESTGKSEKAYELQFNMPIENRDNLNRFAGSQYSLLAQRVDGSRFVVFGQFEADDLTVDNRIQNRMTLKTDDTSARLFEVNSFNIDNIEYIIDDVVTPTPPPLPGIPTGFSIVANGENQIDVSWNAQSNVDNFIIEWGEDGFTFNNSASVEGDQTTYSITGLDASTLYYVRMKAVNETGESGYTSILSVTTESALDPDTLQWISGMDGNQTTIQEEILDYYVVNEKSTANDNWSLTDYLVALQLGSTNGVVSKDGTTISTVNGGVTFDEFGATGNGVDGYINANTNLTGKDNYSLNDGSISVFFSEFDNSTNVNHFASFDSSQGGTFLTSSTVQNIDAGLNSDNTTNIPLDIPDNTTLSISRNNNLDFDIIKNGVSALTINEPSNIIANSSLTLFAAGLDDNPPILFSESKISTVAASASIGFDHAAHNEHVRLLVAGLQVNQLITDINDANTIIDGGLTTWP